MELTSTSMGHIAENVPGITDNLVRALPLDMTDKADTTHGGDGEEC